MAGTGLKQNGNNCHGHTKPSAKSVGQKICNEYYTKFQDGSCILATRIIKCKKFHKKLDYGDRHYRQPLL